MYKSFWFAMFMALAGFGLHVLAAQMGIDGPGPWVGILILVGTATSVVGLCLLGYWHMLPLLREFLNRPLR